MFRTPSSRALPHFHAPVLKLAGENETERQPISDERAGAHCPAARRPQAVALRLASAAAPAPPRGAGKARGVHERAMLPLCVPSNCGLGA
jgi:hypothetical protein